MIAIRLSKETKKRLNNLSKETQRSKSYYVREAILNYLLKYEKHHLEEAKKFEKLKNLKSNN